MESKDFRIGNYHLYDGKLDRIDWRYSLAFENEFMDGIEPIPLTEEWLEKFGFSAYGYWYSKDWFSNMINVSIKHNKTTIGDREEYEVYGIKHVHQLQNLYFALTGEELTLNEEL